MFEEILTFDGEYIIPMLERLSSVLSDHDIKNDLTLGDDAIPGVWLRDEKGDVFITFYTTLSDEENDKISIISLSKPGDGDVPTNDDSVEFPQSQYYRWAFPAKNMESVDELLKLVDLFRAGNFIRVLPTEEMTFKREDESEEVTADPSFFGAFVRLNHLSDILDDEEEFSTGVMMGRLPYLMFDYDDHIITLCYELIDEEEDRFLLHFRTDIELDEINKDLYETKEEFCQKYNYMNGCSRAFLDIERITLSPDDEESDYITIHACIPENGGAMTPSEFASAIEVFMAEIQRVLE